LSIIDTAINLDTKFFNDYNPGHKSLYICTKFILYSHILLIIFAEYIFTLYKKNDAVEMSNEIVIIGAGHAGGMTAISLRQKNYDGLITLIGKEAYLPYQRPPLSKGFLAGEMDKERLYLKTQSYFEKHNIHVIKERKVLDIDRDKKNILLDDRKQIEYGKLVVATGSTLNKINTSCRETNIHYLRTIADALKIQQALKDKNKITIIGAGYIGLEIASIAARKNINTTIIEMEDRVMSRVICPVVSDFFQKKHEAEGVKFKFNVSVIDIEDNHNQKQIKCTDGAVIDTDAVVIGVGIKPNIELAINSGLVCQDGIVVDENGQTSDESIFAAGDCTNHPNSVYHKRLRLESVHNAVEQAKSVAASISGESKPYHQVPWFWSDQYNLKLQIAGISQNHDQYVVRGDMEEEQFTVFYLKKKKIIAVDTINNLKEFFNGKKLIAMGAEIPLEVLQNKDTDLKELIKHY